MVTLDTEFSFKFQGNPPSARCAHTSSLIESNLIVFGGGDGNRRMKDVYILQIGRKFNENDITR